MSISIHYLIAVCLHGLRLQNLCKLVALLSVGELVYLSRSQEYLLEGVCYVRAV